MTQIIMRTNVMTRGKNQRDSPGDRLDKDNGIAALQHTGKIGFGISSTYSMMKGFVRNLKWQRTSFSRLFGSFSSLKPNWNRQKRASKMHSLSFTGLIQALSAMHPLKTPRMYRRR